MLEIDESLLQTEPDCRAGLGHSNFILRTPSVADLETLVRLATDPILAKNLCDAWLPTTMRAADAWLEHMVEDKDPTRFTFVLTDMQGTNLGAAAVMLDDDRVQAEVSIVICRDQWQKGYATRALQAVADFAFSNPNTNQPKLESLSARCRVSCRSSRRLVEKCGFQYCGTGMAHSTHFRGMIPIDRYRMDRGIWTALRHWAGASRFDMPPRHDTAQQGDYGMKGAA